MRNESNNLYEFDDFVLNTSERNLWRHNELVSRPPKVFDTLCLLVENHGSVLTKEEMLDTIWEGTFVEENNLSQNISNLRKTLGKEKNFIETLPRQGYRFVAPVRSVSLEHSESIGTDGNGYIFATQTRSKVIEESVIEHETPVPVRSAIRWPRNSRRSLLFGYGIAFMSIAILGIFAFRFSSGSTLGTPIPAASFDYEDLTDSGDIGTSSISPDGNFVAFLKGGALQLMDLETRNAVEVKIDGDKKVGFLQFSPDSKTIYFRTRGNPWQFENIYRITKFGGESKLIAKNIWGRFSLSSDGKRIAYFARDTAESEHRVIIRNIESGREETVLERSSADGYDITAPPVFSPDGKKLVVVPSVKPDKDTSLVIVEIASGREEALQTNFNNIRQVVWNTDGKSLYLIARVKGKSPQIWNVSYPAGDITRVTSDSHAYRSLGVSSDGKISANRLFIYSNLWVLPGGDLSRAEQLTKGENEIGGLVTTQVIANGEVLFNARRKSKEGIWALDINTRQERKLTVENIELEQQFGYSKKYDSIFCEHKKAIWKMKTDGTGFQKVNLGEADSFTQPAVSPGDDWLYYVKRNDKKVSIWRKSLESSENELVLDAKGFSPDTFLRISPDERFIAFDYVTPEKLGNDQTASRNVRKFGFLDLVGGSGVKVVEVPSHNTLMTWTNGGESFDFPRYVKGGTAIYRKNLHDDSPAREVVRLDNEMIYRFGWSPDEKNLIIARGNHKIDLVLLETRDSEK